jgi:hypothetical protein
MVVAEASIAVNDEGSKEVRRTALEPQIVKQYSP